MGSRFTVMSTPTFGSWPAEAAGSEKIAAGVR